MSRQPELDQTVTAPHTSRLLRLLERWWWVYALLAFAVTVWYTPFDWYQIDGDAVGYMDISDYILGRHWSLVVNGYWHPLYPAMLALGQKIFHPTRFTELGAFYRMSDVIFLLEILSLIAFVDSLCRLRTRIGGAASRFLLGAPTLQCFSLGLLVIAAQRELSPGKIRPDALLQALLLFGAAAMARYLATDRLLYAALMGVSLGLAYLTKSFALAFTLACLIVLIPSSLFLLRQTKARTLMAAALMVLCFGAVAGPYIAALSHQHHRLDTGDSGPLNYAWFIGKTSKLHLQPWMQDSFGSSAVHLAHPEKQLLADPPVYSFQAHPGGTYPPWFDPAYFNEGVVPHASLLEGLPQIGRNLVLAVRYVFDHLEAWILLALLGLCGVPLVRGMRARIFAAPFLAVGLAVWCIYGLVNVEQRYVTVGFLIIIVAIFASLPTPASAEVQTGGVADTGAVPVIAAAVILSMALLATGESVRELLGFRRAQSMMRYPAGWYNPEVFIAAEALTHLGLPSGAAIGCIGRSACLIDTYTTRLAGMHITSEIFVPTDAVQDFIAAEGPARMQAAADAVRRDGGQVIIGSFDPGGTAPIPPQWHRLGGSSYRYLDLREIPPADSSAPAQHTKDPGL